MLKRCNSGTPKIDIWHGVSVAIIAFLVIVLVVGSIWSAFREMHIRDLSKEMSGALGQMAAGWDKVTANAQALTQRITESTQLSREQRQELLALLRDLFRDQKELQLDIERRLCHALEQFQRDRAGGVGGGTQVNFNSGADRTQIGDGNNQR